jgi:hypothetical protein
MLIANEYDLIISNSICFQRGKNVNHWSRVPWFRSPAPHLRISYRNHLLRWCNNNVCD